MKVNLPPGNLLITTNKCIGDDLLWSILLSVIGRLEIR